MSNIIKQPAAHFRRTTRFKALLLLLLPLSSYSQGIFWSEDFGTSGVACDAGTKANSFSTLRGVWTVIVTGINDSLANEWYISASEAGQATGVCSGNSCISNPSLTDRSLHISNVAGSPNSWLCPP